MGKLGLALALTCALVALFSGQALAQPAFLETRAGVTRLMVDGAPFLILGGEVGNSTASDLANMQPHWPRLKAAGLNTVLLPVEWDQIEPEKGRFDFSVIDGLIRQANEQDMKIVVLWLGAWKNSMSTYVPSWVKRDRRFSRSYDSSGVAQDILSAHDADTLEADGAALAALMAHLKAIDVTHTVIMIQVENEIGMLPTARDHGPEAEGAWRGQVPAALMSALKARRTSLHPSLAALWAQNGNKTSGTWAEVFGTSSAAEEVFQAWSYARFVEAETARAKAIYDLPMYVNAALNREGRQPGQYPSAGPLSHLFDVWKAAAPSLDFLAPDIYWPDYVTWVDRFAVPGNPLFIPEANQAGKPEAAANAFYAIGEHRAFGFSPFSIEDLPENDRLTEAYDVLDQMTPLILSGKPMRGVKAPVSHEGVVDETPRTFDLAGFRFRATMTDPWTAADGQNKAAHGALVLQTGPETFIVAGSGVTFTFTTIDEGVQVGLDRVLEGRFDNGVFVPGRWLNGDQTHQGRHVRLPPDRWSIQQVTLYRYH